MNDFDVRPIAARLDAFAAKWRGRGREKQETQLYWLELLEAAGVPSPTDAVRFETPVASNGFADVWLPDVRLLVEQKTLGVDPDAPETRQGVAKTPIRQALDYANAIPLLSRPRWLAVCTFDRLRVWDTDADPLCQGTPVEWRLDEYAAHAADLARLVGGGGIRSQRALSLEASRLVGRLHDALWPLYRTHDERSHHDLAVLTVRLVFLMYAEDAHVLGVDDGLLSRYVRARDPQHLRAALLDLLDVLETPVADRDPYLTDELKAFPYVDGGLFSSRVEIPLFDGTAYRLLDECLDFDWSGISPVVFGSLMEETLSHDERRRGGMHYTSPENIHRVVDPLFLDRLQGELDAILRDGTAGPAARARRLDAYRTRLAGLKFLDPACGSGNFLTETYLSLRRLENRALKASLGGQAALPGLEPIRVRLGQFHGIEINDFAVCVARTALWIAEQQAAAETEQITGRPVDRLPLRDEGTIIRANALEYDWNSVLDGGECDYVMGNPPFVGQRTISRSQKRDLADVWGDDFDGYLDYVTGWFIKAARYCVKPDATFAFVSTASVCQGTQAPALFEPLNALGWRIAYARLPFRWDAQTSDIANVVVIVLGMSRIASRPILYRGDQGKAVANINAYLAAAPDVYVRRRTRPICEDQVPTIRGLQPTDGGNLILADGAEYRRAMDDPIAARYVRRYMGGDDMLKGRERWCLWLADATPRELRASRLIRERLEACRNYRESAPKEGDAYKLRRTPWLFREQRLPETGYILIPVTSTSAREWMVVDYISNEIIPAAPAQTIADPDGLQFAIISSRMFMTWQKAVGGRLGDALRFSSKIVWNNLPLPKLSDETRQSLIAAGRGVLAARAEYPDSTLADLYDPRFMPSVLRRAHEALDRVADAAFGATKWLKNDDEKRLETLLAQYSTMNGSR
ncbi:DNA methyltransferase [Bifidobacterium myosotis]|uniref:site-specific DNA-methyltransferase (adenine-specific) n=1 Tax=Bifidobacterium myosotis TaxID=1630166 RepID=A0A5M9ZG46_9BIFI|nr:DNA methyltransferase [Bifidobacterium myosotis]KAA8825105.1 class I SAM-dependent DNA methyltransferase [Bifidobacterium myosotis]